MKKIFFVIVALLAVIVITSPLSYADESAYEIEFWQSVKNSHDPDDLDEYIRAYPKGKFAGLARNRIKRLMAKRTPLPRVPAPAIQSEPILEEATGQIDEPPAITSPGKPAEPPPVEPVAAEPAAPPSSNAQLIFYIQDTCGYCEEWVDSMEEDCNELVMLNRIVSIDGKAVITSRQPGVSGILGGIVAFNDGIVKTGSMKVSPGAHAISYECKGEASGKSKPRRARQSVSVGEGEVKHILIEPATKNVFDSAMKISVGDLAPPNIDTGE